MTHTYRVNSSHGTLTCNAETGEVIEVDQYCTPEDCEDCAKNPLSNIVRVNFSECFEWWANKGKPVSEWRYDFDILDLGYWYKMGDGNQGYDAAVVPWREDALRVMSGEDPRCLGGPKMFGWKFWTVAIIVVAAIVMLIWMGEFPEGSYLR